MAGLTLNSGRLIPASGRRALLASAALLLVGGGYAILTATVTTRQGIDSQRYVRPIPVYVKAIDFVHRHYQYELLASEIVGSRTSETDRVLAVFDWTRRNIRQTPDGWPIVDDHVLNIIIRGHGVNDQISDVFATLSTYAGVPSFWKKIRGADGVGLIVTFAHAGNKWVPFDAWNGVVFRNGRGELAGVDELVAEPALIAAATAGIPNVNYVSLISRETMVPFGVPQSLRSDLHRPWPRLWYESRRVIGLERDEE